MYYVNTEHGFIKNTRSTNPNGRVLAEFTPDFTKALPFHEKDVADTYATNRLPIEDVYVIIEVVE